MSLLLGVGLMSVSIVLYAWAFGQYRKPSPPRWTRNEWITMALTVATVFVLPVGLGNVVAALIDPGTVLGADMIWAGPLSLALLVATWWAAARLVRAARSPGHAAPVVPLAPRSARSSGPARQPRKRAA